MMKSLTAGRKRKTLGENPVTSIGVRMMRSETGPHHSDLTPDEARQKRKREAVVHSALLDAPLAGDQVRIRPMQLKDCAPCFHLGEKVFTSQFPNLYRLWDEYEVIDAYSSGSERCYIAETTDRKLVGFVFGTVIKKRRTVRYGYIHWIAVDPMYQRRGIGTMLYHRVLPLMTEQDGVRLLLCDTPADNHSARAFFTNLGFADPINHVYMSKNLSLLEDKESSAPPKKTRKTGEETKKGRSSDKTKSAVSVREMTIDDIYDVYQMGEMVFGDRSPNLFRFWETSEVLDLFETDSEFCFVAEMEDELVGFCLGTTIKKKKSAWKYGYLIWLAVSPNHQGHGIGAQLAAHFQERAYQDGCRMIFIDTQADSDAVYFWQKQHFGHAQDHVFLSKRITDADREAMLDHNVFLIKEPRVDGPTDGSREHLDEGVNGKHLRKMRNVRSNSLSSNEGTPNGDRSPVGASKSPVSSARSTSALRTTSRSPATSRSPSKETIRRSTRRKK